MANDVITPFLPKNRIVLKKYFHKEPEKLTLNDQKERQFVIETFGINYEASKYYKAWMKEKERKKKLL